ncbi:uncharacterized protein ACOB8E_007418 [Sarcophilus harrisii]
MLGCPVLETEDLSCHPMYVAKEPGCTASQAWAPQMKQATKEVIGRLDKLITCLLRNLLPNWTLRDFPRSTRRIQYLPGSPGGTCDLQRGCQSGRRMGPKEESGVSWNYTHLIVAAIRPEIPVTSFVGASPAVTLAMGL